MNKCPSCGSTDYIIVIENNKKYYRCKKCGNKWS
jgi:uncharacterized Zn finger protein